MEHRPRVTGNYVGAGELAAQIGKWEEVEVGARLQGGVGAGEEARDERSLVQHVALRRAREHGRADGAEVGGQDVLAAAIDVGVVRSKNLAEGLPRLLDLRRGPLLGAGHPLVVDVRT